MQKWLREPKFIDDFLGRHLPCKIRKDAPQQHSLGGAQNLKPKIIDKSRVVLDKSRVVLVKSNNIARDFQRNPEISSSKSSNFKQSDTNEGWLQHAPTPTLCALTLCTNHARYAWMAGQFCEILSIK